MLRDRDLLDGRGILRDGVTCPCRGCTRWSPRVSTRSTGAQGAAAAASVVGKVFSAQAVAGLLDRPTESLEESLHALTRKDFLRPHRRTGQQAVEYSFWHVLIRDVAYASLPRAGRARLHASLVSWIESQASDRVEDVAEILAHHATEALTLAEATGDLTSRRRCVAAASLHLRAGECAVGLDTQAAARQVAAARELRRGSIRTAARAALGSALFDVGRSGKPAKPCNPSWMAAVDVLRLLRHRHGPRCHRPGNAVMLSGESGPRPEADLRPAIDYLADGPRPGSGLPGSRGRIFQGHEEGSEGSAGRVTASPSPRALGSAPPSGPADTLREGRGLRFHPRRPGCPARAASAHLSKPQFVERRSLVPGARHGLAAWADEHVEQPGGNAPEGAPLHCARVSSV